MCYFYRTALSRAICAAIALLCAGVLGAHAEAVARYTVDDCLRIGLDRSAQYHAGPALRNIKHLLNVIHTLAATCRT